MKSYWFVRRNFGRFSTIGPRSKVVNFESWTRWITGLLGFSRIFSDFLGFFFIFWNFWIFRIFLDFFYFFGFYEDIFEWTTPLWIHFSKRRDDILLISVATSVMRQTGNKAFAVRVSQFHVTRHIWTGSIKISWKIYLAVRCMKLAIGKSLRRAEPKVGLLKYFFSFFFYPAPTWQLA